MGLAASERTEQLVRAERLVRDQIGCSLEQALAVMSATAQVEVLTIEEVAIAVLDRRIRYG